MKPTAVTHSLPLLLPLFVGGLAVTRLLYELLFPRWLWLARPLPALLLTLVIAGAGWWAIRRYAPSKPTAAWLPLLLNLLYLPAATVDPTRGRFIFAASVWLTAVLLILPHSRHPRRSGIALLWLLLAPIYWFTMSATVGRADTFEFQVVAPQLGIAHPTGYPLYLLLGKLWTLLIPWGSVAWRLNVSTAVYALLAVTFLYLAGLRLLRQPVAALLGAVALGLTPTFWRQAIAAEVYALHALFVSGALLLALTLQQQPALPTARRSIGLTFLIGLGLTNHLTTLFLLPVAALTFLLNGYISIRNTLRANVRALLKLALTLLLPLTLYAYLPLRWAALHGEAMGLARFADWVLGGRFQDALQWSAWLHDPTRYAIVARLFLDNWGALNLLLAAVGLLYLLWRQWRAALLLFVAWFGFSFYALNYYVPDLDVFLMGAQVVMTIWWMAGASLFTNSAAWKLPGDRLLVAHRQPVMGTLLFAGILLLAAPTWPRLDQSQDDGLTQWGTAVLNLPLAANAAILADSEKIAPLYYLQQAEGMRPDLDIMVLPDEATYRAELDGRLAAGQTVYLARFLPGLEGVYHLRAVGPLTEVSTRPLTQLPPTATPASLAIDGVALTGYVVQPTSPYGARETAVTLYWQTTQPITQSLFIYTRWQGQPPLHASGQHAVHNNYPTLAWKAGEIVPDFYRLPHPVSADAQPLTLQVALAPPFTPQAELAWQTIATIDAPPTTGLTLARPLRAQLGSVTLSGAQFPESVRPQTMLPVRLSGYGEAGTVQVSLRPLGTKVGKQWAVGSGQWVVRGDEWAQEVIMDVGVENGRYALIAHTGEAARCGWLRPVTSGCVLGEVTVTGAPLPTGAANFDDKIALLNVAIDNTNLQPGGLLHLTLTWQALTALSADYTVFVQVLDADDRIVGQVDAWPVQGTRPTSQWTPGSIISDPYGVQLSGDLPPGQYRLIIGWYLLADLRRLPLLDADGRAVDDKFLVPLNGNP